MLGVLVEKQATVPDTYPLSLNALVAGCNQKTGRQPVIEASDAEVLTELVEMFLLEYHDLRATLERSLDTGDLTSVAGVAHRFKGTVAIFGAEPARVAAASLEATARDDDAAATRLSWEDLRTELDRLEPALTAIVRDGLASLP